MARALTLVEASVTFDTIVEFCGARESMREDFLPYLMAENRSGHEFRFCGKLGFGGKLYFDGRSPPRVDYYPEDKNGARDGMVSLANHHLRALFADTSFDQPPLPPGANETGDSS